MPLALGRRLTPKFFGISDMPLSPRNRKNPGLREYKTVTHNSVFAAESQNAGWPNRRPAFFLVTRIAGLWVAHASRVWAKPSRVRELSGSLFRRDAETNARDARATRN